MWIKVLSTLLFDFGTILDIQPITLVYNDAARSLCIVNVSSFGFQRVCVGRHARLT